MIAAWGSRGDIEPVAALAGHLKDIGRDVLVFATPPATNLLESQGLPFVAAHENIETFMGKLFGEVDLSDRSLSGVIRLVKFGRKYINHPEYVQLQHHTTPHLPALQWGLSSTGKNIALLKRKARLCTFCLH